MSEARKDCLLSCIRSCLNNDQLEVQSRVPLADYGTHRMEVLSLSGSLDAFDKVLIKRESEFSGTGQLLGRKLGVEYEIQVYGSIIRHTPDAKSLFVGKCDGYGTKPALILRFLNRAQRVCWMNVRYLYATAEWLGRFHRAWEDADSSKIPLQLIHHDRDFVGKLLAQRPIFSESNIRDFAWVANLREEIATSEALLHGSPLTVIHGEFFVKNILVHEDEIYPVDWESAAIGLGELDLATLTYGYPEDVVDVCKHRYRDSRWGRPAPDTFETRFSLAQAMVPIVYWNDESLGALDKVHEGLRENIRDERLRSILEL
jgi:hypothetical protein